AREFVRATRGSGPDDLLNSAIGGFASGALLGRLQGGQVGAIKYSVIFAIVGTSIDFAALQLSSHLDKYRDSMVGGNENSEHKRSWLRLPEWSPIQVLDEEALAAKRAREEQLYRQRTIVGNIEKE
ncbi:Mitochondrial import inner membrane translocase subunit tim17 tim22 tim23 family protein, partial [Thalictrum thalictroides]